METEAWRQSSKWQAGDSQASGKLQGVLQGVCDHLPLTLQILAMTLKDGWVPGIAIPMDDKGRVQRPQAVDGHPVAARDERQQLPAGV